MKKTKQGQLDSVLDWLVAHRRSRVWLGKRLGYTKSWVSQLFMGKIGCSVPMLLRLSKLTGIELEQLARECVR